MAYRTTISPTQPDYNGIDPSLLAVTCDDKGLFQFEIASTGKVQILNVVNGSGASISVVPQLIAQIESKYDAAPVVYTVPAGESRMFSEFTPSTFGVLESAASPADAVENWFSFLVYTGSTFTEGDTLTQDVDYIVISDGISYVPDTDQASPDETGFTVDSGTYRIGDLFTPTSQDVTDFDALSGDYIVAKEAGSSVALTLFQNPS